MSIAHPEEDFAMRDRFDIPTAAAWCRRYPAHRDQIAGMAAAMAAEHAEKRGASVVSARAQAWYAHQVLRAAATGRRMCSARPGSG